MWTILQTAIVLAVTFANIYWELTPNGYVAGFLAGVIAFGVTWLLSTTGQLIASSWHWLLTWNTKRGPQPEVWCRRTQTFVRIRKSQNPGKLTRYRGPWWRRQLSIGRTPPPSLR